MGQGKMKKILGKRSYLGHLEGSNGRHFLVDTTNCFNFAGFIFFVLRCWIAHLIIWPQWPLFIHHDVLCLKFYYSNQRHTDFLFCLSHDCRLPAVEKDKLRPQINRTPIIQHFNLMGGERNCPPMPDDSNRTVCQLRHQHFLNLEPLYMRQQLRVPQPKKSL